jgi:hypothetical protein
MTNYLIYRHGSNAANQPMTPVMALDIVEAKSQDEAKEIAMSRNEVYHNQYLSAVPESKAKVSDWNSVSEQQSTQFLGDPERRKPRHPLQD